MAPKEPACFTTAVIVGVVFKILFIHPQRWFLAHHPFCEAVGKGREITRVRFMQAKHVRESSDDGFRSRWLLGGVGLLSIH